ncbi:hypothetical protein M427DRAFT_29854 [Gonapodya prolifera JEL478]|uniref:Intraflagellar transport protein 46 homolog n=1 Tax=Gonapodya prolifera (strain JEL478) TaxID=1344416 RepID=A0A139AMW7_GONPJ|nr:hypothetical protein M427DRAFT_29854 [Gonapodya prolifera JEL478]|eukprot:KXS18107.1 hypothetical protein M427DRAFT_29854 [Gonapodya prolifera JEL478]
MAEPCWTHRAARAAISPGFPAFTPVTNNFYDECMDASDSEDDSETKERSDGLGLLGRGDTPPDARMSDDNRDYDESEDDLSSLPPNPRSGKRPAHNSSRRVRLPRKTSTNPSEAEEDEDISSDAGSHAHPRRFTDDPSSAVSQDPEESHSDTMDHTDDDEEEENEDDIGTSNGSSEPSSARLGKRQQGGKGSDYLLARGSSNSPLSGHGGERSSTTGSMSRDLQELFSYVGKFKPHEIELEPELRVFLPDYIPAVGDIDAFVKIPRPDGKPDTLGLTVLDEPAAKQSDPHVLSLQLRSLSKTTNSSPPTTVPTVAISSLAQNSKSVDQWIKGIEDLHNGKPRAGLVCSRRVPDVEEVMQAWDEQMESVVGEVQLPPASLDLPLPLYAAVVSILLDIPVPATTLASLISAATSRSADGGPSPSDHHLATSSSLIESLHLIFSSYNEFKNSQHFGLMDVAGPLTQHNPVRSTDMGAVVGGSSSRAESSGGARDRTAVGSSVMGVGGLAKGAELPSLPPLPPMEDKLGFSKSANAGLGWSAGALRASGSAGNHNPK